MSILLSCVRYHLPAIAQVEINIILFNMYVCADLSMIQTNINSPLDHSSTMRSLKSYRVSFDCINLLYS